MVKLIFIVLFFSVFSCTRAQKDSYTQITISLPNYFSNKIKGNIAAEGLNPNSSINPASISELNCFAILVSGPEDELKRNICQKKIDNSSFKVGYYVGGFLVSGTNAKNIYKLDIKNGKDRALRLAGFKVDATGAGSLTAEQICKSFKDKLEYQTYVSDPYLISEVTGLEMSGGEKTVPMTAAFNIANEIGDCKGPDFPDGVGGNQRAPYKFGLSFQDGLGGSSTPPLRPDSCLGLRIQLQDVNGNRAVVAANDLYQVKLKTFRGGAAKGFFYNPSLTNDACSAANAISSSGDVTLSFNDGNGAFTDKIVFFGVNPTASNDGLIEVEDAGVIPTQPLLMSTAFSYNYTTTTSIPVTYAVYDVKNNASSANGTDYAHPVVIDRSCRMGFLQIMNAENVPMRNFNSSGPIKDIYVSQVGGMPDFYLSSTACTANSASLNALPLSPPTSNFYTGIGFYYKAIKLNTTFGFNITNTGSGTPVAPSQGGGQLLASNELDGLNTKAFSS